MIARWHVHNAIELFKTAIKLRAARALQVLILLCVSSYCYMCPHTAICVLILLYVSSTTISVFILLHNVAS